MLYDPKWEIEARPDVFSLKSLIGWLERQPSSEQYCYADTGHCLLSQYFTAVGFKEVVVGGTDFDHADAKNIIFPKILGDIAYYTPRTFGGALDRALKALGT